MNARLTLACIAEQPAAPELQRLAISAQQPARMSDLSLRTVRALGGRTRHHGKGAVSIVRPEINAIDARKSVSIE